MPKHVGVKKNLEHSNKNNPLIPGAFVGLFTNKTL
jgi:hypothetical protein